MNDAARNPILSQTAQWFSSLILKGEKHGWGKGNLFNNHWEEGPQNRGPSWYLPHGAFMGLNDIKCQSLSARLSRQ